MNHFNTILRNGNIYSYVQISKSIEHSVTSVGIVNGKIHTIGVSPTATSDQEIDLTGLTLFPGIIDSQVHFREPGMTHKEDLESGTRSAILGGITSVFEMPNTMPSTTTEKLFQQKLDLAHNRAHCNYGFFIGGASDNVSQLADLEKHPNCSGVKVFLGSSFGNLLVDDDLIFENILKSGKRRVIIHSEDEKRLKERKSIAVEGAHPRVHHIWRDEESAMISTKKSIAFARKHKRPVHLLHISSSEEMDFLSQCKDIATVEILPQFLLLSAPECCEKLGTLAQQNPPIRDKRHLEFLWKAVLNGTVDILGSDHAPHTLEEKQKPYPQSPSGVPGVQTMLPLMLNQVHLKKLPLEKLLMLLTENPCKTFGVQNKGRIEVGYDADFTVVDLKRTETISKKWLASKVGWSPFEGERVTGWPVMSILAGQVVMREAEILMPSSGTAVTFQTV